MGGGDSGGAAAGASSADMGMLDMATRLGEVGDDRARPPPTFASTADDDFGSLLNALLAGQKDLTEIRSDHYGR